jgi:hypothetical protein
MLAPYVTTIWWLYFTGFPERLSGACFNTALLVCVLTRTVACAAHAAKLRAEHNRVVHLLDKIEEDVNTGSVPLVPSSDLPQPPSAQTGPDKDEGDG